MPHSGHIRIAFGNFWTNFQRDDNWFLGHFRRTFPGIDFDPVEMDAFPDVLIASVFGSPDSIRHPAGAKVFFSGENLARFPPYDDPALLEEVFDLVVGFEPATGPQQVRFPLWLLFFDWVERRDYYEKRLLCGSRACWEHKRDFACLISRSDFGNRRALMHDALQGLGRIACPSAVRHNCEPIGPFREQKTAFMNRFAFNLCPENTFAPGYVTEKLFESFESYCIPVYWGNQPAEPQIINSDRILYFDFRKPEDSVEQISRLWNDRSLLEEWLSRPIFNPGALEAMEAFHRELDRALSRILERVLEDQPRM